MIELVHTGVLLPETFLQSRFFLVLSTLVALNTTVYAVLAIAKLLPKLLRPVMFRRGRNRQETRSIYPDAER